MVIIAVDDERLAVDSIIKSIRSVVPGAEVYGFRSGVSALDFLESHPVDVAFLDIEMRDMNGMDLAAQIRRRFPRMSFLPQWSSPFPLRLLALAAEKPSETSLKEKSVTVITILSPIVIIWPVRSSSGNTSLTAMRSRSKTIT